MIIQSLRRNALVKTIFFLLADIFFTLLSVWLAFVLRFDGRIPDQYMPFVYRMAIMAVIFIVPIFYILKLYSFSWAYVSTNEILSLFKATTVAYVFLSVAIFVSNYFPHFVNFPRSTIFISYILIFLSCGAIRMAKRVYITSVGVSNNSGRRTLIVGAGDAGEQLLRNIINSKSQFFPIGFVDDNPVKQKVLIHGLRVLGRISDIPKIASDFGVKQVVIALPSAGAQKIRQAIKLAKEVGIWKIKTVPPMAEIINGKVTLKSLRDVEISDLLGREEVLFDEKKIETFIRGKNVLITGAAGSIGSEITRQIAKFKPAKLAVLDQDETGIFYLTSELSRDFPGVDVDALVADITAEDKMQKIFSDFRPQLVFHAAAYKHVPLMEKNRDEAVRNNIDGTRNLTNASLQNGVEKFIFISTDKAVNPVSVMGATKRVGEMICQLYNEEKKTKFISVRFGNVLNSRGSVIPIFKEQISRGGPVEVTHPDMKRYFMLTSEACLLVMEAAEMGKGGEVFVLDMGQPIKILDLAKEMIRLSGQEPDKDVAIVFTGVRPGEKLFEEILTAEEGTVATQNKKIFIAKLSKVSSQDLATKIENLRSAKEL